MNNLNITEVVLKDLDIHELALSTPAMTSEQFSALKLDINDNGQLEPIKIYRGRVVDGRHRTIAMKELGMDSIDAIHLDPSIGIGEVRQIVSSCEVRRHQTPTQKAIHALMEYDRLKLLGQKVSQANVCEQFGTNRMMLGRAKKLSDIVSASIVDHLFNGGKINIGTKTSPLLTDSLFSVCNYFQTNESVILESSTEKDGSKITDDERLLLNSKLNHLKAELGSSLLKELNSMIHKHLQAV